MPRYINPSLNLKEFKEMGFRQFISDCYSKALLTEHRNMLLFCYLTGIRPIELQNLKREDIRITKNTIDVVIKTAKGGNRRLIVIPIVNQQIKDLAYFISTKNLPKEYIFPSFSLRKNSRDYFLRMNKKYGIGVVVDGVFYPYSIYFFRHNILTLLAKYGADLIQLLFFKGASLKFIFKSAGFYIHMSKSISLQIAKILKKILLES